MATQYNKLEDQEGYPLLQQDGSYIYLNPLTRLWSFLTKHASSFTNLVKHTTDWASQLKVGFYQLLQETGGYIIQENGNYILEDQTNEPSWTNKVKHI